MMYREHFPRGDILIIDDNSDNQYLFGEILKHEGYKARPAITGKIGLMTAREVVPDLVLLDLVLPDISGYEVLEKLKTDSLTAEIPVIIISVLNTIEDKIKAFHAGCIDYINKPFQPDEVMLRINTHIDFLRSRRKLRESESRYYELFNNISSGVAVYRSVREGEDFEFVDYNKAGMHIDQRQGEVLLGKTVREVFSGVEEFGLLDVFRRVWQTGVPERHPVSFYKDSMISGWRENYVYKLPSGEIVAVYEDVTEKKQAEAEAQEYSELARSLLMATTDAALIFEPAGTALDVNQVFLDSFRITREQIIGKNCWQAIPDDFTEKWKRFISNVLKKKQAHRLVNRWENRWYDTVLYPVFDAHNTVVKLVVFFHDITEKKVHEEKMNKALAEKEVLLKEIHHRVKNNLQIIASMLSLQARYLGNENTFSLFEDSKNRIFTISLVHQLLYQSGDLSNIDFRRYTAELTSYLYQSLGLDKEKVKIVTDIEGVMLNMNQAMPCGLIINELISNSLKYAFPDDFRGEIRLYFRREDAGSYLLVVTDNGRGIPADVDTAAPATLGLKLVHTLTDQLGGTLLFNREKGTRIEIKFPVASHEGS